MIPVHIQTTEGLSFWNEVTTEYRRSKMSSDHSKFRQTCFDKYCEHASMIAKFIADPVLEKKHAMNESDKIGWKYWKEASDKAAILKYYAERLV